MSVWDVIDVKIIGTNRLWVRFIDGLEGQVQFLPTAFRGVFTKLSQPEEFNKVYIDNYFVTWPGELDLAPDNMYRQIHKHGEWIIE